MTDRNPGADPRLVDGLNDLLRLEHDAGAAYNLAFENMRGDRLRLAARVFRIDHERHAADLARLVRARGGEPVEAAHMPAGFFEQAMRVAAAEGDREMLEVLRINEALVRERYRERASGALPEDLGSAMRRLAADEERHWAWVTQALEALGGPTVAEVAAASPAVRTPVATDAARGEAGRAGAPEHVAEPVAAAAGQADVAAPGTTGDSSRALAAAGTGLEEAARGLDRAASWARRARGGKVARVAPPKQRAARVLTSEGTHLPRQDLDAMTREIESGVRAHPIRAVLIVAAVGFVVGRLLR